MQDPPHIDLGDDGNPGPEPPDAEPPATPTTSHTINLGDISDTWAGLTVTIRPFLSFAADQRIESSVATTRTTAKARNRRERRHGRNDDTDIYLEAQPLDYAAAVIEEAVLEWNLVGADNRPLPATAAAVRSEQAPAVLLTAVIDEIMDFYEAQRPDPTKRS